MRICIDVRMESPMQFEYDNGVGRVSENNPWQSAMKNQQSNSAAVGMKRKYWTLYVDHSDDILTLSRTLRPICIPTEIHHIIRQRRQCARQPTSLLRIAKQPLHDTANASHDGDPIIRARNKSRYERRQRCQHPRLASTIRLKKPYAIPANSQFNPS